MPETIQIRRHENGSIDLNHYVRTGRGLHGKAVRDAVAISVRRLRRALSLARLTKRASPKRPQPAVIFAAAE